MAFKVSVVIVTFHREHFLRRTLWSCLAQREIDLHEVEVLVIDGSRDATARSVVEEGRQDGMTTGVTVRYLHEPRPGISHSRNTGVRAANSELIAFIDDDEEADPLWLARLVECQARFDADVVAGPVYPIFEMDHAARDPYWRWYFTCDSGQASGEIVKRGAGTHNCLLRKRTCCINDEPFDPSLGLTGGEDTHFFQSVASRGGRVVWCAEAVMNEFIPASRSQWAYALRRRLRESQLLTQSCLWARPPNFFDVGVWMAIGMLQIAVFSPLWLLFVAVNRSTAMKCATKVAGGVGKVFWFPGMTLIGYGDRRPAQWQAGA